MASLKDRYKLYTVTEVADLFPTTGSQAKHLKAVEEAIRTHGNYRLFGDTILLTDADVAALINALAVQGPSAENPGLGDDGHIVFVGSRTDVEQEVFVTWSRPGRVDATVREVQEIVPDVHIIDFAACTYGDYLTWVEARADDRSMGKWFARTKRFNRAMAVLFPAEDNDNVEIVEVES